MSLEQRKRVAVQARMDGASLRQAAAQSGLSQPTVIAAYRAWQRLGWAGLATRPGGRPPGSGTRIPGQLWQRLCAEVATAPPDAGVPLWTQEAVVAWLNRHHQAPPVARTLNRYLRKLGLVGVGNPARGAPAWWRLQVHEQIRRRGQGIVLWLDEAPLPDALRRNDGVPRGLLRAVDGRGSVAAMAWQRSLREAQLIDFLERLQRLHQRPLRLILAHPVWLNAGALNAWMAQAAPALLSYRLPEHGGAGLALRPRQPSARPAKPLDSLRTPSSSGFGPLLKGFMAENREAAAGYAGRSRQPPSSPMSFDHLDRLEAESIFIFREVVAEAERPVLLYSIGKDSAVLLHLALKAFYPARLPFPLLHVDTTWKFQAMYAHRDQLVRRLGLELITYTNPEGLAKRINPFTHGANVHTDIMKTQALKQALDLHRFDVAFGGARRDEEKSRAKERVLSFRNAQHRWNPKDQRPELWRLYNGRKRRGESLRAFPLSNWTEADIWQYIQREGIELVPLYLAAERPVVERDGALIMVDDARMQLRPGEVPVMRKVRFRTLGCYPLTGAIESDADSLEAVVAETLGARTSERQGRVIDQDPSASMERKKQEGYF